jgi:hypothetical protein
VSEPRAASLQALRELIGFESEPYHHDVERGDTRVEGDRCLVNCEVWLQAEDGQPTTRGTAVVRLPSRRNPAMAAH